MMGVIYIVMNKITLAISLGLIYNSKDNISVHTSGRCITQLAKMSIDPKFVQLTADVFGIFYINK